MNCEEFAQRMHHCLDHRSALEDQGDLASHASQCESCRAQLEAWQQISSIMPEVTVEVRGDETTGDTRGKSIAMFMGLAAAVLFAAVSLWGRADIDTPVVADSTIGNPTVAARDDGEMAEVTGAESGSRPTMLAQAAVELDPTSWWQSVQDQDWVDRTMPAVRSVQEGVAPLGRSLMRAVTILTTGGHDQTS